MAGVTISGATKINNSGDRPQIITEPDGSTWMLIFHHNNPSNSLFESSDYFTAKIHLSEDLYFNMCACNSFTKWEMMVKQSATTTSTLQKYRWVQNYNPMTATFAQVSAANVTFTTGGTYTTPGTGWGGFYRQTNGSCYINANNGGAAANWWGALGAWIIYENGFPGYNGVVVTTGYLDVYIRIDNGGITAANLKALLDTNRSFDDIASTVNSTIRLDPFTLTADAGSMSTPRITTTKGRPVLITISGDVNGESYAWFRLKIYRDEVLLKTQTILSQGGSINMPFGMVYLDCAPAGTHDWDIWFERGSGSPQFGEEGTSNAPVVTLWELR